MSRYIDEHRGRFGVEPICRVLDVSASVYYQRATGERSQRVIEDERLSGVIRDVHEANYCAYGYRRPISSGVTSAPPGPMPCGSRTSRICAAGKRRRVFRFRGG